MGQFKRIADTYERHNEEGEETKQQRRYGELVRIISIFERVANTEAKPHGM